MLKDLELSSIELSEKTEKIRGEVREFLDAELAAGTFTPQCDTWLSGWDENFSRKLGERGWLGMTWSKEFGGQELTALDRYVVTEELLAYGAPVAAHWIADRQSGPLLLRYGNEKQKKEIVPGIARGEVFFAIGLSEPNSGSDLASVSTSANRVDGGWRINGSKVWTSGAHSAHFMIALCRSSAKTEKRHEGLSQFVIDLSSPGVTIKPIRLMNGEHDFNEVFLDHVFVPDDMVVGEIGNGWKQSVAELAFERSGPERFLSTFPLLVELIQVMQEGETTERQSIAIGQIVARLFTLREMSLGIAASLEKNISPEIAAALVKDLGTQFECEVTEVARQFVSFPYSDKFDSLFTKALIHSPGFTLRGGTTEILRGIIAKGVGVK